jgi:hypothetical protein
LKPGRAATFPGRNFSPHHEPMMMSGMRSTTSAAVANRSSTDFAGCSIGEYVDAPRVFAAYSPTTPQMVAVCPTWLAASSRLMEAESLEPPSRFSQANKP